MESGASESTPLIGAGEESGSSKALVGFSCLAILARVAYFIITPLWIDYFTVIPPPEINITTVNPDVAPYLFGNYKGVDFEGENGWGEGTSQPPISYRITSVYFVMLGQWSTNVIVFGIILILIKLIRPSYIRPEVEESYPKREFITIGLSQAVSTILCNYSLSGTRTPPYLIAILSNCNIPIQFFIRWLVLRRGSSRVKLICAVTVTVAVFVSMIPTIFPSLEGGEGLVPGGGTGAERVLWPLCFIISQVPFSIANTLTERSVQKSSQAQNVLTKLNIFYFLFWSNLFTALTVLVLFWTDIIPGFGTAASWSDFISTMLFDTRCLFGAEGEQGFVLLGWFNFICALTASLSFAGMIRYSEGANFTMIIMSLRTPLIFLFWTLFDEKPFRWRPHAHLGTWLSIAAICVMLPVIYLYNRDDIRQRNTEEANSRSSAEILNANNTEQDEHQSIDENN